MIQFQRQSGRCRLEEANCIYMFGPGWLSDHARDIQPER
jgi:hypothetical protein